MLNWKNQGNEPGSEGGALNLVLIPYLKDQV